MEGEREREDKRLFNYSLTFWKTGWKTWCNDSYINPVTCTKSFCAAFILPGPTCCIAAASSLRSGISHEQALPWGACWAASHKSHCSSSSKGFSQLSTSCISSKQHVFGEPNTSKAWDVKDYRFRRRPSNNKNTYNPTTPSHTLT